MISNQILQSTIDGLKVISRIDLSVMDLEGNVTGSDLSGSRRTSCFRALFCGFAGGQPGGAGLPVFQGL